MSESVRDREKERKKLKDLNLRPQTVFKKGETEKEERRRQTPKGQRSLSSCATDSSDNR